LLPPALPAPDPELLDGGGAALSFELMELNMDEPVSVPSTEVRPPPPLGGGATRTGGGGGAVKTRPLLTVGMTTAGGALAVEGGGGGGGAVGRIWLRTRNAAAVTTNGTLSPPASLNGAL
jgi:hypothetical protein